MSEFWHGWIAGSGVMVGVMLLIIHKGWIVKRSEDPPSDSRLKRELSRIERELGPDRKPGDR